MNDATLFLQETDALTSGQTSQQILQAAYELLSDPQMWCTKAYALTTEGRLVRPNDPSAVVFSLEGAVAKVSNAYGIAPPSILHILDRAVNALLVTGEEPSIYNTYDAGWFNDVFEHSDVLAVLETALTLC